MGRNIVIFGDADSGKKSLINLILGCDEAKVSDAAPGCPFQSEKYMAPNGDSIFDTTGLNEADKRSISAKEALSGLIKLFKSLEDGVNLMICVIGKGRITQTMAKNHEIFVGGICQKKVPVILIIPDCEMDADSKAWFSDNKKYFDENKMLFDAVICGCLTNNLEKIKASMRQTFLDSYNETKIEVIRVLNREEYNEKHTFGHWFNWFKTVIGSVWNSFGQAMGWSLICFGDVLKIALMETLALDETDAKRMTAEISSHGLLYIATSCPPDGLPRMESFEENFQEIATIMKDDSVCIEKSTRICGMLGISLATYEQWNLSKRVGLITAFDFFYKMLVEWINLEKAKEESDPTKKKTTIAEFVKMLRRLNLGLAVEKINKLAVRPTQGAQSIGTQVQNECPVCFENPKDVTLDCGHRICAACLKSIQHSTNATMRNTCPFCRHVITLAIKNYN